MLPYKFILQIKYNFFIWRQNHTQQKVFVLQLAHNWLSCCLFCLGIVMQTHKHNSRKRDALIQHEFLFLQQKHEIKEYSVCCRSFIFISYNCLSIERAVFSSCDSIIFCNLTITSFSRALRNYLYSQILQTMKRYNEGNTCACSHQTISVLSLCVRLWMVLRCRVGATQLTLYAGILVPAFLWNSCSGQNCTTTLWLRRHTQHLPLRIKDQPEEWSTKS